MAETQARLDDIGRRILVKHLSRRWQLVVALFFAALVLLVLGYITPEIWQTIVLTELGMYGLMDLGDRWLTRRQETG